MTDLSTLPTETVEKAAQFFTILEGAKAHGKDWWVGYEIERIQVDIAKDKALAALTDALEMVRDADEDCKKDGLPTIPPMARAKIDAALAIEIPRPGGRAR